MVFEIETFGMAILFDLLYVVEAGSSRRLPGGAVISLPELPPIAAGKGTPTRLKLTLHCGRETDVQVSGNWLYETLKGKARKLWVDRVEVLIDRQAITQALIEKKVC